MMGSNTLIFKGNSDSLDSEFSFLLTICLKQTIELLSTWLSIFAY